MARIGFTYCPKCGAGNCPECGYTGLQCSRKSIIVNRETVELRVVSCPKCNWKSYSGEEVRNV